MELKLTLNGRPVTDHIDPGLLLIDFLRNHGCYSVKRGCETSGCGLCTVLMDGRPILSCSMLAARAAGHSIHTLEGLQEEAADFAGFIADQGADQCGFCNPGFVIASQKCIAVCDNEILSLILSQVGKIPGTHNNIFFFV